LIVDTSAVIAILQQEPDAAALEERLVEGPVARIAATNWFEAAIVIDGRGDEAARARFEGFFRRFGIEIEAVTPELAAEARRAYRDWGRGNHPARLNFGDCFAYALAKQRGEPLLFKGVDFARTDIEPALKA